MNLKKNKLTITGDKQIDRALKNIPDKVAKKAFRKSMRPAMKVIQKEAKDNAPVDSGDMKKSIKVKAAKRSRRFMGIDVVIGEEAFKGETWYGNLVEYGTSKMPAKPFMRPAYDSKDQVKNKVLEDLPKILDEEVRKEASKTK